VTDGRTDNTADGNEHDSLVRPDRRDARNTGIAKMPRHISDCIAFVWQLPAPTNRRHLSFNKHKAAQ